MVDNSDMGQEMSASSDIVFLGSKNTKWGILWMRQNGLEAAVKKLSCEIPVFGICGGYQMLGASIADPDGVRREDICVAWSFFL